MTVTKDNDLIFYRDAKKTLLLRKITILLTAIGCLIAGVLFYFGFATLPGGRLEQHDLANYSLHFRVVAVIFSAFYALTMATVIHPPRKGQSLVERLFGMKHPRLLLKVGNEIVPCQIRLILWNNQIEKDHGRMEHIRYGATVPNANPITLQFLSPLPDAVAVTAYRLDDTPFQNGEKLFEQGKPVYADHGNSCITQFTDDTLHITLPKKNKNRIFVRILCGYGTNFHGNLMELGFVITQ